MLIIFVKEKPERYPHMVKIDTKEKFCIFRLDAGPITEKMAGELRDRLLEHKTQSPGNVIVVLPENTPVSQAVLSVLSTLQNTYRTLRHSFVISPVSTSQRRQQPAWQELDTTPSLQEAIDLVMMEEVERELLGPEGPELFE